MSPIVLYFLHSTSVLSFYIDVVLTLFIICVPTITKYVHVILVELNLFCFVQLLTVRLIHRSPRFYRWP